MALLSYKAAHAQYSSKGFGFQGYAVDIDQKALASVGITVRFTISRVAGGGTDYVAEHTLTTDAYGVFSTTVGSVAGTGTAFTELDFTKYDYRMKVEVKKTSGGSYTTISDKALDAVPYARSAANGVPVGTVVAFAGPSTNVPAGWLLCDGLSYNGTSGTYKQLYDAIQLSWGGTGASSFRVPDLRGRFIRGVDNATGNDPDAGSRTAINTGGNTGDDVGTLQTDEVESHTHAADQAGHTHGYDDIYYMENNSIAIETGATFVDVFGDGVNNNHGSGGGADSDNQGRQWARTTASTDPAITVSNTGGNETRPVNAAVHYIIKY